MSFQLNWHGDRLEKRYRGFLSHSEFVDAIETAQADFRYDKVRYVINDLSAISGHNLSLDDLLYGLSLHIGAFIANPKCTVLFVIRDTHLKNLVDQAIDYIRPSLPAAHSLASLDEAHAWADAQTGNVPGSSSASRALP